jgi:hypothetical protein
MNSTASLKIPRIVKVNSPEILKHASGLSPSGKIAVTTNNLTYLKIDDNYIHELYPLLTNTNIQKPNYFNPGSEGAHITVIYPEENKTITTQDLNQDHHFIINNIATAEINNKKYYVLLVESPSLIELRHRYQLPGLLSFRGYAIGFHITFGFETAT